MAKYKRVVVTGMGIISSLGMDKYQVLDSMKRNLTGISKVSRFATEEMLSNLGGEIKGDVPAPAINKYNKCIQLGIHAAQEALQDSGLDICPHNAHRFALCFGTCNGGIAEFEKAKKLVDLDYKSTIYFPLFQQGDGIAKHLGIAGPVISNVTACAASGHSLTSGYEMLAAGNADAVLVGGADTMSETVFAGFNSLQSLSPSPCAPFGYPIGLNLGEGAAFIVLEALESALARKAHIYGEICGYGLDQDAYHITAPHPEGDGIARTVASALNYAKVEPGLIGYINTHGTGTGANDACELMGLKKSLGEEAFPHIPLSSSKAYFGHTLGAAAIIEIVSSLAAIKDGLLPATLHTETAREGCAEANLILSTMKPGNPEYFLCNNSAFGGHNSAILFRNWHNSREKLEAEKDIPAHRVGIFGISMANQYGCLSGFDGEVFQEKQVMDLEETRKVVKEYIGSFYSRRMSIITQYCIAGADLSLKDAQFEVTEENCGDTGLVFGTMYGASESFNKYLQGIFEKGVTHASALYFPDTSANTTPGKAAIQLGIKGCGTTISTGGNEGLHAVYTAYNLIKNGSQKFCLAGAAEEFCNFSQEVNRVLEIDKSVYPITEGSSFMFLGNLDIQDLTNTKCYGEIEGFGFSFGLANYGQAVESALNQAGIAAGDIDFVFYNDEGLPEKRKYQLNTLEKIFAHRKIPIKTFNDLFGYALSVSSMYHLCLAAQWLLKSPAARYGLVISSSYNNGNGAMVIRRVES